MVINRFEICVDSEIGELEGAILHTPGKEIEDMTPENAERALYSDILNLSVASREYAQLRGVLDKVTQTFHIRDLLTDVLANAKVKENLVKKICENEEKLELMDELLMLSPKELGAQLIEGVVMKKDNLSKYLSPEYYALQPLHNYFFTRDSAISMDHWALIAKMADQVREREPLIMEAIFDSHPSISTKTVTPPVGKDAASKKITIEGGDVLVARDDILLIGIGARSTPEGVDFIIDELNKRKIKKHIIVQELPMKPESFIHLDMVFTLLDKDKCMAYEPIILKPNRYQTVHIALENGKVSSIREAENIPSVLKTLGMELEPILCGGSAETWVQEREQWHSGANFFALGPGKVIGYGRNVHTIEAMSKNGFEVIEARDVLKGKVHLDQYEKYVVTIGGAELSRGGGGCRCMTMPIRRKAVDW
ncbi:MAG: arginine deiminase [bacterium]|nr:arginine deiminase [bacterium]